MAFDEEDSFYIGRIEKKLLQKGLENEISCNNIEK
jgi:hypothetical protein